MSFFHHVSAAVVLYHNGKALILKRGDAAPWLPGKWNLPGGASVANEKPEDTAARECLEETGFQPGKLIPLCSDGAVQFFAYEIPDSEPIEVKLNYENSEARWIEPSEIGSYDFVPGVAKAINIYLPYLRKPVKLVS